MNTRREELANLVKEELSKVGQKTLKMIISQEESMFSAAAKTAIYSIFD